MAVVITVAQQKGGTGKTTLAANLAAAFAPSRRVALLDIDPQKSLGRWHSLRRARLRQAAALAFSDIAGWRLPAELERLKRDHDVVLIDSPPQLDTDARVAVRAADLVLVPIQPSMPDVWAAEGTLKLAADERRRAHLMFNRSPPASKLRDAIATDLADRRLPLLRSALGNRAGFAHAFAAGLGVTEAAPRSIAAAELRALLAELQELTE
jgi:chromosome partitioning protein